MLSFGLGICSAINVPDFPSLGRVWKFLTTPTGMTITDRPDPSTFIITEVSAQSATVQRG